MMPHPPFPRARPAAGPLIVLLLATGATAPAGAGSPEGGARRYLGWLRSAIEGQRARLPAFAESADAAARRFVERDDWEIGVLGRNGFTGEATGRAGGIIRIGHPRHVAHPGWRGVILVGLVDEQLDALLARIEKKQRQGAYVVAFGTPAQRAAAAEAGVGLDAFIPNGASPHDGLVRSPASAATREAEPRRLLPTQHVANVIALWTWTGEFLAAVTRRGRMVPVYLAYTVPGGKKWRRSVGMTKLHGASLRVEAVPAKRLGGRFLDALRADLDAVAEKELPAIRRVASMAMRARRDGGTLYAYLHGHAHAGSLGGDHDPGYFTRINSPRGVAPRAGLAPEPGDLVFCLGFDALFEGDFFDHFARRMREKGVGLAWSVAVNHPRHDYGRPDGEPLIDQHWAYGDASVRVPGYPLKILPTSGVIGQAILWMVQAEMLALER